MSNKRLPKFDIFNLTSPLFIILYLCIGFIPNLEAVDKIAPQWLAMTALNLMSIFMFINFRKTLSYQLSSVITSKLSIIYIAFIFWAGASYFYAINPTEVIVNITRQVNVLIMFLSMAIFLINMKYKKTFLTWVITIILSIEIYAVLNEALGMIKNLGFINSGALKGVTANRNITAFSLAIKIPFLLYLIHNSKKLWVKLFTVVLIFLCLLGLSMIQSRASFIAIGLIFIAYLILKIYLYFKIEKSILSFLQIGYLIIPLFVALTVNQIFLADKGADAFTRAASISLSTNDGSVNQRLRYYQDVLTHLKSNPILGTGLGNWKLKSIEYDSNDIEGYVVPYHAHSDFIQLGAELGIIGFSLYLGIFLLAIFYVYKLIRYSNFELDDKLFLFFLLTALGVYSIDANLNFPIARPQVLVVWTLIMSLISNYYQKFKYNNDKLKINKKLNLLFLSLALLFLLPSLHITNKVYKSLKGQMFLLQDFNSNSYNIPLNNVESIVPEIPNITVTTIPINSVKARYFFNAKKYKKALELLNQGTNANPYLYYSEILKSQIFESQGNLDSAKTFARKAFFGLPNNALHASRYVNLVNITNDKVALEEAFDLLTNKNNLNNWRNYLLTASNIGYIGNDNSKLIKRAKRALNLFPDNRDINNLYNKILVGENSLNESIKFSNNGLNYFNQKDYQNASKEFEKALKANPLNYAHYENAATSNYMIGNLKKALEQIDKVIDDLNPLNGKSEYIKALIFIKLGDPVGACPLLEISLNSGYNQARTSFDQYCK